jgi:hypothetical protein
MKLHRPWQPHLDSDPLFNPFVPTTTRPFVHDHTEFTPEEGEENDESSPERAADQADGDKE